MQNVHKTNVPRLGHRALQVPVPLGLRAAVALAAAVVVVLIATPADAHIGAPEGRAVFLDDNGDIIGAGTTWGVLEATAEGYVRTCEEAVGDVVHFYYWAPTTNSVVVGTGSGVQTSTDYGCSWSLAGVDGLSATIMRTPRDLPGVLFVVTSTAGEANGVFRSIDDGQTWAATALSRDDFAFTSLQVSEDGQTVVASGIDYITNGPRIFLSVDGGANFEEKTPLGTENTVTFINAVGIEDDAIALTVLRSGGAGSTLYLASLDLATIDAGIPFDEGDGNGVVTDYKRFDGTEFVLVNRTKMLKRAIGTGDYNLDDDGPARCLRTQRESDRLWGCGQPFQLGHFLSIGAANEAWDVDIAHLDVFERRCPVGTIGEERCRYLFEPVPDAGPIVEEDAGPSPEPTPDARPDPEPSPDPEPDCNCDSTSDSSGANIALFFVGLMALVGGLRRRR